MSLQWKILDGNCKIEIWVFEQVFYEVFGWKEAVDGNVTLKPLTSKRVNNHAKMEVLIEQIPQA